MRRKFITPVATPIENPKAMLTRTIMNNTYELCGLKFASIPTDEDIMALDTSYQRLIANTVSKIASNFDMKKVKMLTVSYRDGKFYVIDGQHRLTAARIVGIKELPCIIYTGLTRADEALMFAQQNVNVKKLTPFDTFKANLACGNADIPEVKIDMDIARVCTKYSIEVKKANALSNPKILRALSKTRRIVKSYGADMLDIILNSITSTNWNMCADAYNDDMISTLLNYFVDNTNDLHTAEKQAKAAMNAIAPTDLVIMARSNYPEYKISTALNLCFRDVVAELSTNKNA